MVRRGNSFFCGVSLAMLYTVPAWAAPVSNLATAAADAEGQAQAAPESAPAANNDIVVTAQRRTQRLQDVPMAVSAFTGEQLAERQINTLQDLQRVEPSLKFRSGQDEEGNSITIRGIGTQVFSVGVEPSVSYVVDGVVLGRQGSAFIDLIDIDRVEVLRGPQGTLFGKNASAGVVNVITQRPTSRFGGAVDVEASENGGFVGRGTVSVPLGANVAARLTGFYRTRDGYVLNYFNGQKLNNENSYGGRAKVQFGFGATSLLLIGDYSKSNRACCAVQPRKLADDPARAALFAPFIAPVVPSEANTAVDINTIPYTISEQGGISAELKHDFSPGVTLTSITAYRKWYFASDNDAEGLPFADARAGLTIVPHAYGANHQHQFTQELRLNAHTGAFDVVGGMFYFDQTITRDFRRDVLLCGTTTPVGASCSTASTNTVVQAFTARIDTKNLAGFADVTARLAPMFELFGGVRVSHEKLAYNYVRTTTTNGAPVQFSGIGDTNNDFVTGRGGARIIVSPDVSFYGSYNRGYKGKGFDITTSSTPALLARQPVNAETSDAFEVGFRSRFWDHRGTFNVTAFSTRYHDFQAQSFDTTTNSFSLQNVGIVDTKGVEAQLSVRPVNLLHIDGAVSYIDSKIKFYPNGSCYAGQARVTTAAGETPPSLACGTNGTAGTGDDVQNLAGGRLPDSPKWRANISVAADVPLASLPFNGFVRVGYNYQSSVQYQLTNNPRTVQPGYGIFDGSIGIDSKKNGYRLTLFVRNMFDKSYAANIFEQPGLGGNGGFAQLIPFDAHRYFGASASMKF